MTLNPEFSSNAPEFSELIQKLALNLHTELRSLRVLPSSHRKSVPETKSAVFASGRSGAVQKKTVLLARTTDDLYDETLELRSCLNQYADEVAVIWAEDFPSEGEEFRVALAQSLASTDLFVQLLGPRAGRLRPDVPEGYTRCQVQAAVAAGIPIMQWRHPAIDVSAVSDTSYRGILTAETVVSSGLQAFRQQVLDWARRQRPKPKPDRGSTVFINADNQDLNVAKQIARECVQHAFTTIIPPSIVNREDLENNLTDCDILVFIYGNTTEAWIRRQLLLFNKLRPKREAAPKLLAICSGPPEDKPDIGVYIPNAQVISCPECWNIESILNLISEKAE